MPKGEKQLAPLTLRSMTDVEAAWVGAMIEAEGTIRKTYSGQAIHVPNTDAEVLSALLRATGIGCVYPKTKNIGTRDIFQWVVQQRINVQALLERIAPYSMKAQRALA